MSETALYDLRVILGVDSESDRFELLGRWLARYFPRYVN